MTPNSHSTECHVFFGVFEFGEDIERVTQIMGVEPTKAWIQGERNLPHPRARHTHCRWELASGLEKTETVEAHLDAILVILEQRPQAVSVCMELFRTVIWVAIYTQDANPGFTIDADLARRIADLGVSMDVDIYHLPEDP